MPRLTQLEMTAKEVQAGDVLEHGGLRRVDQVDTKVKWTRITYNASDTAEFGGVLRLLNDSRVRVRRELPTEEELAAEKLAKQKRQRVDLSYELEKAPARAITDVENAMVKLQEASVWRVDMQWAPLNTYLRALVHRDLWTAVQHVAEQVGAPEGYRYIFAVETVAEEETTAMIDDRYRGSSSDPVSCAADHIRRAETSKWLRDYRVLAARRLALDEPVL